MDINKVLKVNNWVKRYDPCQNCEDWVFDWCKGCCVKAEYREILDILEEMKETVTEGP